MMPKQSNVLKKLMSIIIELKEKYSGYFFVALFLIIAGIVMLFAFDEAISRRIEIPGKVISCWHRDSYWDPNRKSMTQEYFFIQAETSMGTFDFNVARSQYAGFQKGDETNCTIGKGFFRKYPIGIKSVK
jgi:hypothetical protein